MTEHIQPLLEGKRIPAALVAAFLLQTAGALFWAGSAAERITVLENRADAIDTLAIDRESTWDKLNAATFLTTDEKRAAAGYGKVEDRDGFASSNP